MMKIYSISDKYIGFLRNDKRLYNVYDNKENEPFYTNSFKKDTQRMRSRGKDTGKLKELVMILLSDVRPLFRFGGFV